MCCTTATITENSRKQSKVRLIAMLLCVCFIAAALLSAAFVLSHANHEHDYNGPDGSCGTCACVAAAQELLKTISTAVVAVGIIFGGLFSTCLLLWSVTLRADFSTLVGLKIRLNI
jgi:hypothetical protein